MKKVLVIGDGNHTFIHNLYKRFDKKSIQFDLLQVGNKIKNKENTYKVFNKIFIYGNAIKNRYIRNIVFYCGLLRIFLFEARKYDFIQIHYIYAFLYKYFSFIPKINKHIIVTIWGSDYNLTTEKNRSLLHSFLLKVYLITVTNEELRDKILKSSNINPIKIRIVRFGLEVLDQMHILTLSKNECRAKLDIPSQKTCITIGYNLNPNQQHISILKTIVATENLFNNKEKLFFLIPITYGCFVTYKQQLLDILHHFPFEYKVFESYMSDYEVALLTRSSDIFIQLQKHDQFSGSMQQYICEGKKVITGSWLAYNILRENNCKYYCIDNVEDIGKEIELLIETPELTKEEKHNNKKVIYNLSSWDSNINDWKLIYV